MLKPHLLKVEMLPNRYGLSPPQGGMDWGYITLVLNLPAMGSPLFVEIMGS